MRISFALSLLAIVAVAGPAAAQEPAASAPAKPDKKICKRSVPIGSLIATRKECHTKAEWNEMAQNARADGQEMMDRRVSATPMNQ